jgi:hypothetical protein
VRTSGPGPRCDRCGAAVERLEDAMVSLTFDERDVLVAAVFTHQGCAPTSAAVGERIELLGPTQLGTRRTFEKLSSLARFHPSASITRVARKASKFIPRLKPEPTR